MNNMKESFEKNKQLELELQAESHTKTIGKENLFLFGFVHFKFFSSMHKKKTVFLEEFIKNDLIQNHYMEMDELRRMQEKEILTCKMELERAIEINKLKVIFWNLQVPITHAYDNIGQKWFQERESQIKHENFQTDLGLRQRLIDSMTNEIRELKTLTESLKQDINQKQQDLQQHKQDAQNELRLTTKWL